ncbi:MAG TPA: OadG family protein [Clostridiaceae bacterium]|nr:OadG family protein [Clostridiaceae bacterium]
MLRLFAAASADRPEDPSVFLIAIIGFASVFVVLMLFWLIISVMQKKANKTDISQKSEPKEAILSASENEIIKENTNSKMVPYAYGKCDLHDVDDRTAALLMAIVADKIQFPLNELYFKSIRSLETDQK